MTDDKKHELEQQLLDINRDILTQKAIYKFLMYQAHEMQYAIKTNEKRYSELVKEAKEAGIEGRYLTHDELSTLPKA